MAPSVSQKLGQPQCPGKSSGLGKARQIGSLGDHRHLTGASGQLVHGGLRVAHRLHAQEREILRRQAGQHRLVAPGEASEGVELDEAGEYL